MTETRRGRNKSKNRRKVPGVILAPGIAIGKIFHYRDVWTRSVETRNLHPSETEAELARIRHAIGKVREDLTVLQKNVRNEIDQKHAEIFEAQQMILEDRTLFKMIKDELKSRLVNADRVVRDVFHRIENKFRLNENEVFKGRADDFVDIRNRLLRVLIGVESNLLKHAPMHSIILTHQMLPSDTIHLDVDKTRAIITTEGGVNSHAAILARAIDVPLISGIDYKHMNIQEGSQVIVDGFEGCVVLNPSADDIKDAGQKIGKSKSRKTISRIEFNRQKKILSQMQIQIKANVASRGQIEMAGGLKCDGIGLYRMEHLYMSTSVLPTHEYLYGQLFDLLSPMQNKDITLRLLDLGGDKRLPYLPMSEDEKSPLGLRGVRLLLKYPHLLETQINVCLRLSADYRIKILIPMVTFSDEIKTIRDAVRHEMQKLRKSGMPFNENVPIGAMVETPSAALTIDQIIENADFISIGTNDLVQYTMATDRERVGLRDYYDLGNQLILRWLGEMFDKAQKKNIEVEVCGELAGDLRFTRQLLEMGLKNFSVFPNKINELRSKILEMNAVK